MDYQIIKNLCQEKGITFEALSEKVGMSRTGMSTSFKNNSLKIETLEKIAEVFGVSPSYFFSPEGKTNSDVAKFEYLRNEVLDKTSIRLDTKFHIDGLFRSTFLKNFIDTLENILPESDKKAIMGACGLQGRPFCFDTNKNFHTRIAKQVIEYFGKSDNRTLKNVIRAEYQNVYQNFATHVAKLDPVISFLREEEMINEIDLLMEIEKVILSTFNCNINFDLHDLEPSFDISVINDASYYITILREEYQIL